MWNAPLKRADSPTAAPAMPADPLRERNMSGLGSGSDSSTAPASHQIATLRPTFTTPDFMLDLPPVSGAGRRSARGDTNSPFSTVSTSCFSLDAALLSTAAASPGARELDAHARGHE